MGVKMGQYGAYLTPGGTRFQKDGKLVGRSAIPEDVASLLDQQLKGERGEVAPNKPSPEELRLIREEALRVPEHLQMTATEVAERTTLPEPLSVEDFEDEPVEVPRQDHVEDVLEMVSPPTSVATNLDYLESVSIHTASLADIAQALLDRFGIYTVYLNKLPEGDEYNPLTAEPFTKYHLGIAYQAAIRAQNQGILTRPAEEGRQAIDQGRNASTNFQSKLEPVPYTMGEARKANSFDYRTSVKGMNEHQEGDSKNGAQSRAPRGDEDEPILEAPIGGRPIIRPDW